MVRESGIPATKPVFMSYLLPSFDWIHLPRSLSAALPSSIWTGDTSSPAEPSSDNPPSPPASPSSDTSTAETDEDDSPALTQQDEGQNIRDASWNQLTRLGCTAEDTLKCLSCSADLAFASQIISKGFTGRYGRAILVAPTQHPDARSADGDSLLNIRIGASESRELATGWHTVADVTCENCNRKIGWKYVDAEQPAQQYKIGKFILETERVVTFRNWDLILAGAQGTVDEWGGGAYGPREEDIDVQFDSQDSSECEDLFEGTWTPKRALERRRRKQMARIMMGG